MTNLNRHHPGEEHLSRHSDPPNSHSGATDLSSRRSTSRMLHVLAPPASRCGHAAATTPRSLAAQRFLAGRRLAKAQAGSG